MTYQPEIEAFLYLVRTRCSLFIRLGICKGPADRMLVVTSRLHRRQLANPDAGILALCLLNEE